MSVLKIVFYPDERLRAVADVISVVDDSIRKIIDDMFETMYHDNGIGLAANQVGILKRVIVMDTEYHRAPDGARAPFCLVNPEISSASAETSSYNEGCLSIPGVYADVVRPKEVRVKYLDYNGESKEVEATGLLATCIQHEIDHINGKLFVDYLSPFKRNHLLKKMRKK